MKLMRIGLFIVAILVMMGTSSDTVSWRMKADYVEACSCHTFCPCYFNKQAEHPYCKFNMAVNGADYPPLPPFTLNATERRFLPVAVHHENGNDKFIHIRIPVGGYVGNASDVTLPLTGGLVTLKATCAEARATQQVCRLYVDDTGRLRIEKA